MDKVYVARQGVTEEELRMSLEQVSDLDLIELWFSFVDLPAWEASSIWIGAVKSELERRGIPLKPEMT